MTDVSYSTYRIIDLLLYFKNTVFLKYSELN